MYYYADACLNKRCTPGITLQLAKIQTIIVSFHYISLRPKLGHKIIANFVAVNIGTDRNVETYDLASYRIFLKSYMSYIPYKRMVFPV